MDKVPIMCLLWIGIHGEYKVLIVAVGSDDGGDGGYVGYSYDDVDGLTC